jgi:SAM-dependent methyltransferase
MDSDEARVNDCIAIADKIGRKNMTFFVGSGHDSLRRFISGAFGSALAVEVLQYVPDPLLTLRQICRLLMPGGRIIGHVPVLGYLREHEQTLFDDLNLSAMLRESGFEDVSIIRTFGGVVRQVCKIFECLSHSRLLTAVVFPFLLMVSAMCGIPSPSGDYRFFVAHKPLNTAQATEDLSDSSSSA